MENLTIRGQRAVPAAGAKVFALLYSLTILFTASEASAVVRASGTPTIAAPDPTMKYVCTVTGDAADDFCTIELSYRAIHTTAINTQTTSPPGADIGQRAHSAANGFLNVSIYRGRGVNDDPTATPFFTTTLNVAAGESLVVDLKGGRDTLVVEKLDGKGDATPAKTTDHHFTCSFGPSYKAWKDGTGGGVNRPMGVTDTIRANNTEVLRYFGEPGPNGNRTAGDLANVFDSPGDDACSTQDAVSRINNADLSHSITVTSVPTTYIVANNGGNDYCVHTLAQMGGAAEAAAFFHSAFSYGAGEVVDGADTFTYFNACFGFERNWAFSTHNDDFAFFIGGPGDDFFFGGRNPTDFSYMDGPGFFNACRGFLLTVALGDEGFDTALRDPNTNVVIGFETVNPLP